MVNENRTRTAVWLLGEIWAVNDGSGGLDAFLQEYIQTDDGRHQLFMLYKWGLRQETPELTTEQAFDASCLCIKILLALLKRVDREVSEREIARRKEKAEDARKKDKERRGRKAIFAMT